MRRSFVVTAIAALALLALAVGHGWAARQMIPNGFAADGTLRAGSATVSGHVGCEPGEDVAVVVTLTQDALTAQAAVHQRCTAKLFEFTVTARAVAGGFKPGPARACAHAAFIRNGQTVDTHQWCRAEIVTLAAGG